MKISNEMLAVIAVIVLFAAMLLMGCVSQGQTPSPTASPTLAGGVQQDVQAAEDIPLPSIEVPELGADAGLENLPVDV
ncbi:MAG: hypothetical protein V1717_04560 [Candidatus Micrarchaeota archaeon]